MKKLLLTATLVATAVAGMQAQLSLADRMALRRQQAMQHTPMRAQAVAGQTEGHTLTMITLATGATADDLRAEGVAVSRVRGDIALASVATSDLERVAALDCVARLEISQLRRPSLDRARVSGGVAKAHSGLELDHPYTGKGVITGIFDGGMDPNHINFKNGDGSSRIGYLGHIYVDNSQPDGWSGVEYDRDHIYMFETDDNTTFHGTHTMGILAGGYAGQLEAAVYKNSQLSPVETVDNPYLGVAYEADIAAACGSMYDRLIAEGIDRILDYVYEKKQPCVISLSLGSNTGVHSAQSTMSRFLDLAAKEAIIVVSAGNEGDIPLSLVKTLTETDREAKSFILPTYREDIRAGQVYFYSDKPFELQAVIYNKSRNRITYRMPVIEGQADGAAQYYCSSSYKEAETDIVASNFTNAFEGYVGVGFDTDDSSGLRMGLIDFFTQDNTTTNLTGNYILGFIATGEPGQTIECYGDGNLTVLDDYDIAGWDTGSTDMTISDMACANDVLVVGSYNSGDTYGGLDGVTYGYRGLFTEGKISGFSSYGKLRDGRSLPHVCAPGAVIVSSCSRYYVENEENEVGKNVLCARLTEADRTNYWCPAMGTSMSTPYVAGSIALWLQANPNLTINDVKDIISRTAVRDDEVNAGNPVQWGMGKFDAYAGLKEAIRMNNSVPGVEADRDSALMLSTADGRTYEIFLGGATAIEARLYSTGGACVATASSQADQAVLDASALAPGIYILNVNGTHSKRIAIK